MSNYYFEDLTKTHSMPVIVGTNRGQIHFFALETVIEADNEVRAIGALVKVVPMKELGFAVKSKSHEGGPALPASVLLKLLIYGYCNGIRSSRKLEKSCQCNVELWWLLNYQQPCYKTIADFRKNNPKAIERSEYEDYVVANVEQVKANWKKHRRQPYGFHYVQQAIVEHPFGTMKRPWGYTCTFMKSKEKVRGEFGLIFTSYNFRRVVSILGVKEVIERLKDRNLHFFELRCAVDSNRRHKINSSCDISEWAIAA